jgi:hypothetical protein
MSTSLVRIARKPWHPLARRARIAAGRGVNDMANVRFAARHRWDRTFLVAFLLAAWAAVVVGFDESVSARFAGQADYPAPLVLQLHVFAFTGWMVMLACQIGLAHRGKLEWHRTSGMLTLLLEPVMVITAIGAEIASQRFYTPKFPDNARFFIEPVTQMTVFTACVTAAVWLRRDPPAHKRLMLLATSAVLVAAYNRWWGETLYDWYGDGFFGMIVHNFAGPDLLMAALVGYDLATRGRVHRVYLVAVPLILASQILASTIYHSDGWPLLVNRLIGL